MTDTVLVFHRSFAPFDPASDSSLSLGVVRYLAQFRAPRGRESGDRRRYRHPVTSASTPWRKCVRDRAWWAHRSPSGIKAENRPSIGITRTTDSQQRAKLINRATMAFKVYLGLSLDRRISGYIAI
jgi:hypothetical protein